MKQTIILSILIFIFNFSFGQIFDSVDNEVYPEIYSFKKAKEFEEENEYEKAIWFYINLYPDNKEKVVIYVKIIEIILDTVDISLLIKKSFGLYATFDPQITTFNNGIPSMDSEKLKLKGGWGDELILRMQDNDDELSSAAEYNLRSLERFNANIIEGALSDLDKAIELEPIGKYYFNRAFMKRLLNDFSAAIEDFLTTIELDYKLSETYFERAYCKERINDFDGAIEDYSNAIAQNEKYAEAYYRRAYVYIKVKEYEKALNDLDKAIIINPSFVAAYVNRGVVKKELGDKTGACEDWKKSS